MRFLLHHRGSSGLLALDDSLLLFILGMFTCEVGVDVETTLNIQCLCKRLYSLQNSVELWRDIPIVTSSGQLNYNAFKFLRTHRSVGTEGICNEVFCQPRQTLYACRLARVYPESVGIPYYMIRELCVLKTISHPNIAKLVDINLHHHRLHLFFPFVRRTLSDYTERNLGGSPIESIYAVPLLYQIVDAIAYCHRRGICHRNLKPRHILIVPNPHIDPMTQHALLNATIQIADFAIVRLTYNMHRSYTPGTSTIWYRAPEMLMGDTSYSSQVDMWSIGCVFAEMLTAKPLFNGNCEIDQIFKIFNALGVPSEQQWPAFSTLPYYSPEVFPDWTVNQLPGLVPSASSSDLAILYRCLQLDPRQRIKADELLNLRDILPFPSGWQPFEDPLLLKTLAYSSNSGIVINDDDKLIVSQMLYFRLLEDEFFTQHTLYPYFLKALSTSSSVLSTARKIGVVSNIIRLISEFHNSAIVDSRTLFLAAGIIERYFYFKYLNASDMLRLRHEIQEVVRGNRGDSYYLDAQRTIMKYLTEFLLQIPSDADDPQFRYVSVSCIHIATKCEDLPYEDIRGIINDKLGTNDVLRISTTEEDVLNTIQFGIYLPTIFDFVVSYKHLLPDGNWSPSDKAVLSETISYLTESALYLGALSNWRPSLAAAGIVVHSLACTRLITSLEESPILTLSQYSRAELIPCIDSAAALHKSLSNRDMVAFLVWARFDRLVPGTSVNVTTLPVVQLK